MYHQLIYVCQYCEKRYQKRKKLKNHLLKLHKVHVPANNSDSPESSSESSSNYDSDTPKTSISASGVTKSPANISLNKKELSYDSESSTDSGNKKQSNQAQLGHNWAPKISKFAAEFSDDSDSESESDKGVMVSLAKKVPLSKNPVTKQVSPGAGLPPLKLSSANKQDDSSDSSSESEDEPNKATPVSALKKTAHDMLDSEDSSDSDAGKGTYDSSSDEKSKVHQNKSVSCTKVVKSSSIGTIKNVNNKDDTSSSDNEEETVKNMPVPHPSTGKKDSSLSDSSDDETKKPLQKQIQNKAISPKSNVNIKKANNKEDSSNSDSKDEKPQPKTTVTLTKNIRSKSPKPSQSNIAAAMDEDSDSSDSSADDNLTQSQLKLQNTPVKSQGISMKSQNNSKKKASSSSSSSEDGDSNTAKKPTISKPSNIKSPMNANANPSSKESSSSDSSDSDDDTSKQVSTKQNSLKRPLATTNLSNIPNKKKLATPSKNVNQTKKQSSLDSSSSEDETTLRENIPVKAKSTVSPLQKKVQEDSSSLESESDEDIKKKKNTKFNKAQDINASKRKKSSYESDEEAPDAGFQPPKKTKKEQQAFPLNQNNEVDNQYRDNRVTSDSTKRDKEKKENIIEKLKEENAVLKKKLKDAVLQNANEEYCAVVKIWEKQYKELKEILEDAYLEVDGLKKQLLNCKKNHSTHEKASTSVDACTQTEEIKTGDSDVESEISWARSSPVSSVHTSDLTSFDDEISLSSEDENSKKKTMPLKEAVKKYLN